MIQAKGKSANKQYGVLPFTRNGNQLEVYLITRRQSGRWGVPKGWREPHMSRKAVARMEAYEEAGLQGTIDTSFSFSFPVKRRGMATTLKLFPMEVSTVLKQWPEKHQRKRKRLPLKKAQRLLCCPDLRHCLGELQQQLRLG